MALPALAVQVQGQGSASADNLNTFVGFTNICTDLRTFTGLDGMTVYAAGTTTRDDGGAGAFQFSTASTAADDGANVIAPTGSTSGRWLRLALNSTGAIITGPESTLASATTTDLGTATSHLIEITGVTTITSFGSTASLSAPTYFITFTGALTLTNSSALLLPGAANITTANNDFAIAQYLGTGNWIVLLYAPANGASNSLIASTAQTTAGTSNAVAVSPAGLALIEQTSAMTYAADSSVAANTITLTLTPAVTGYTTGMLVAFKLANTVTGATVIALNGLAAKTLQIGGQGVVAGQMVANQLYEVRYDGTNFQLVSIPYPGYFESATFAISNGAKGSYATGLAVAPKRVQAFLRNVTPEFGYTTGDEVVVGYSLLGASSNPNGIVAWISGTNIKYQVGASSGGGIYDTSGNNQSITLANWVGFLRCWWF